ncbi:hypothetical protein CVS40_4167 [Lucilia cuprina]|nr:hypothetical protein CVS40_4167 [Lucilia cuprina]
MKSDGTWAGYCLSSHNVVFVTGHKRPLQLMWLLSLLRVYFYKVYLKHIKLFVIKLLDNEYNYFHYYSDVPKNRAT